MENKFIREVRKKFELSDFLVEILVNQGYDYALSAKFLTDQSTIHDLEQHVRDNPNEYTHLSSYFKKSDPKEFKLKPGHTIVMQTIGKFAASKASEIESAITIPENGEAEEQDTVFKEQSTSPELKSIKSGSRPKKSNVKIPKRQPKYTKEQIETDVVVDFNMVKWRFYKQLGKMVGDMNVEFLKPKVFVREYDSKLLGTIICPACKITFSIHSKFDNGIFKQWMPSTFRRHVKRKHGGKMPEVDGMIVNGKMIEKNKVASEEEMEDSVESLVESNNEPKSRKSTKKFKKLLSMLPVVSVSRLDEAETITCD